MYMKLFFWMVVLLAGTGWVSCGGSAVQENESPADSQMVAEHVDPSTKFPQQLVTDTLQGDDDFAANAMGSAEETIALAKLAIGKTARADVKTIAQGILKEHEQLYGAFQKLPHQAANDSTKQFTDGRRAELEKLGGADFDRQWVEKMVTWNAAAISRYETAAGTVKDKKTKELVNKTIPILKTHQQQLETCRAKLQ
jgi:putative membrane protein